MVWLPANEVRGLSWARYGASWAQQQRVWLGLGWSKAKHERGNKTNNKEDWWQSTTTHQSHHLLAIPSPLLSVLAVSTLCVISSVI